MRSYFSCWEKIVALTSSRLELPWLSLICDNAQLMAILKFFLGLGADLNRLGKKALHVHLQTEMATNYLNEIKVAILECLAILCKDVMFKQSFREHEYFKTRCKYTVADISLVVCESLVDSVNHNYVVFQELLETNINFSSCVVAQIRLLACICQKNNFFYSTFSTYSELLFKHLIIPMARITPSEREKLESDPSEFVSYSLDLVGYQKSEIVKSECLRLYELLVENIDGNMTKFFRILFGVLTESIDSPAERPVLTELHTIDLIRGFTAEELIDLSLLLLADSSYAFAFRQDIIQQIKGYFFGKLEQVLQFKSVLLLSRVILFFSQYGEYLFQKNESDMRYFGLLLQFLSRSITLPEVPEAVSSV